MVVKVSPNYGILIRKESLTIHNVSIERLYEVMEASAWFDEDEQLISAGPHFGGEAAIVFIKRLEQLGLTYGEDFVDFEEMLPEWCQVLVSVI